MLVCSYVDWTDKLLPVNRWSNRAGNTKSSSAPFTFLFLRPFLWPPLRKQTQNGSGLIRCPVLCGHPLSMHNPSKSIRGHSHAAVHRCLDHCCRQRPDGMRWGARASQLWHSYEQRSHHHSFGVMKWEKGREEEEGGSLWDKLWLGQSEGNQ